MRVGDRVVMTSKGRRMAKDRGLLSIAGEVVEIFHSGRRDEQFYVRRDSGGYEWWPKNAWILAGPGGLSAL